MGYIEKSLAEEEALITKGRFHWLYYFFAQGVLGLCLASASYVYVQARWPWLAAVLTVIGIIIFLRGMVPIWTTEIGVTSERVVLKQGFFTRHTDEIELPAIEEIEEINVDQGFFGRLLGFGRLTVQGTGDDDVDIPAIASPLRFRKSIQQALERMRPSDVGRRGTLRSKDARI